MNELQHHGVKGMKWGVRKAAGQVVNAAKRYGKWADGVNERRHEKSMKKDKRYVRDYNYSMKSTKNHKYSRDTAAYLKASRTQLKVSVAATATFITASKISKAVVTPENVMRGKNIVRAVKRSNFRVVDGKAMVNVINEATNLLK